MAELISGHGGESGTDAGIGECFTHVGVRVPETSRERLNGSNRAIETVVVKIVKVDDSHAASPTAIPGIEAVARTDW